MADICYLHIPFCRSACSYCDFYRVIHRPELERRFLAALLEEITIRTERLGRQRLSSVYTGGGTPSTLSISSWQKIFARLRRSFLIDDNTEITVEANPESTTAELLGRLVDLGVNRLSLGVQAFSDLALSILGRVHNSKQAREAVRAARQAGIKNVSIDLIYGLPFEPGLGSVDAALQLEPEHVSCYALTLEGGVPLERRVLDGEISLPDMDDVAAQYLDIVEIAEENGLSQYEISNFAKEDRECRHNLGYWNQQSYLGFGPSAVSTESDWRTQNASDLDGYCSTLEQGKLPPHSRERINLQTLREERIMLSLRLRRGLDLQSYQRDFEHDLWNDNQRLLTDLEANGDLIVDLPVVRLTPQGMLRYDMIVAALLPEDEPVSGSPSKNDPQEADQ
jgi:oxygen-independent coproporphyrinogen-3 oxidase